MADNTLKITFNTGCSIDYTNSKTVPLVNMLTGFSLYYNNSYPSDKNKYVYFPLKDDLTETISTQSTSGYTKIAVYYNNSNNFRVSENKLNLPIFGEMSALDIIENNGTNFQLFAHEINNEGTSSAVSNILIYSNPISGEEYQKTINYYNNLNYGFTEQEWVLFNLGVEYLNALKDVDINTPTINEALVYDGLKWVNAKLSGNSNFANTIFVDNNGSDIITDTSGQIFTPFKTIEAAAAYSTSGTTIFVMSGEYTITDTNNIVKDNIVYYFLPSKITNTTSNYLFDIDSSINNFSVYGYANFYSSSGVLNTLESTSGNINFESVYCYSTDTTIVNNNITTFKVDILENNNNYIVESYNKLDLRNTILKGKVSIYDNICYIKDLKYYSNNELVRVDGGVLNLTGELNNMTDSTSSCCITYISGNIIFNSAVLQKTNETAYYINALNTSLSFDSYSGGVTVIDGHLGDITINTNNSLTNRTGGAILYTGN